MREGNVPEFEGKANSAPNSNRFCLSSSACCPPPLSGIHRYLEAFPDGGHWIGQNYTFDRRFGHGATTREPEVVGRCACCSGGWSRYQAGKRCANCRMEVLVCRDCERSGKMKTVRLLCFLCGGPKPSYLPEDANTFAPPKPKPKQGKIEADY